MAENGIPMDSLFSATLDNAVSGMNAIAKFGAAAGNIFSDIANGGNNPQPQPPVNQPPYSQPYDPNSRITSGGQPVNPYAPTQIGINQPASYGYGYSSNPNNPYNMNVNGDRRMYPGISNPNYGV